MKKAEEKKERAVLYFAKSNKILIIVGSIAITSWIIPKELINYSLPNHKDKDRFEMIQESRRLQEDEIDIATNYGFKTAKMMMDKGDHKFKPEVMIDNLGNKRYKYKLKKGEQAKTPKQIEEYAIKMKMKITLHRETIKLLLKELRDIGVTVAIGDPRISDAAAVWNPKKQTIKISPIKMEQGSLAVLRVLNHEAIHVAQSCKNGGINYRVSPLGVDISPRKIYNNQIKSKIYSNASSDIKKAEKEAYSYEYSSQSAIYFINKYCKGNEKSKIFEKYYLLEEELFLSQRNLISQTKIEIKEP